MASETKVFISWSGSYSKQVALALRSWLEELFDNVRPFVSDRDIDPGARSMAVIEQELADTSFGIVVITKDNQNAPWLNFEAGALSKVVGDSTNRVIPLLMDMDSPAELTGPIAQFQAQKFSREGMLRIVEGIASVMGANLEAVKRRFDRSWDDVASEVSAIPADAAAPATARRPMPEMVEETLTIVRSLEKAMSRAMPPTATAVSNRRLRATAAGIETYMHEQGIKGHAKVIERTSRRGGKESLLEVVTYGASEDENAKVRAIVDALPAEIDVSLNEAPF